MSHKEVEEILSNAGDIARSFRHEYVTSLHLLAAMLNDASVATIITTCSVDPERIKADVLAKLRSSTDMISPSGMPSRRAKSLTEVFQRALAMLALSSDNELTLGHVLISMLSDRTIDACSILMAHGLTKEDVQNVVSKEAEEEQVKPLDQFCKNLNVAAEEGEIDPVIGRETEITDIIQVLAHRKKNNGILVGEPGVGKTAIAEGLARKIVKKQVPAAIADKVVYSMDIGVMLAGTKFRGDFEERMKNVLEDVVDRKNVILFIDEIHMIMGAGGGNNGSVDASNLLKPLLAKGKLMCIGATTHDEYAKHIEKDRALMRRFQKLVVNEPSVDDAKRIVKGTEKYYTDFHKVKYEAGTIDLAVDLSVRYMKNKYLPDKAFDIIDYAGAHAKLNKIKKVTPELIISAVCKIANISEKMITVKEDNVISTLDTALKARIFNQDTAIETITDAIQLAKAGLREGSKPLANFLFVGPTGVGKTYICKQLARTLGVELVRFDMSEYQEKHSVSKLIGAPPGYVGHGEGQNGEGALIAAVERNPDCVLILDEIEKAAPEVLTILLQITDDARLTSSKGKTVDFSNVILVMTSNAGARDAERRTIGFDAAATTDDAIDKEVKRFFSPEFRNRLDAVVKFNRLNRNAMTGIVNEQIAELNRMLVSKNLTVSFSNIAIEALADKGFDPAMGARPLKRVFDSEVKRPLSKLILSGALSAGKSIHVGFVDGKFQLDTEYGVAAESAIPA